MLTVGDQVADRYRIDALLGEGGFSSVYAGFDTHSERRVALKILKPDHSGVYPPRTRARYVREIQMVARLRSAHTVRLFDHGETDTGFLYMVFEHIEGEDLDQMLKRVHHLEPDAALHVLEQLLDALAEAHAEGLLHRDIKSSNIRIFAYMGDPLSVKLLDFGLARPSDGGHPGVTATGEFIGTPRYMAPEQLLQEELTPATDIYCLGLVAYEMLLGRDVLSANSVGHQIERLQSGHTLAPQRRPELDPRLADVLERMTARDPEHRFQSAQAVLNALRSTSAPPQPAPAYAPSPAPQPRATERAPQSQRWSVVAAALLGLGALAGVLSYVLATSDESTSPAAPATRTAPVGIVATTAPPVDAAPSASAPDATTPDATAPDATAATAVSDISTSMCPQPREFTGRGYVVGDAIVGDRWLTYVPEKLRPDEPAPVVILAHQQGHDADTMLDDAGFVPLADEHGFIIIAANDPAYDAWAPAFETWTDFERLRERAFPQLCVDESQVFLVGHGNGGSVADEVMCRGWLTGLATHALARRRDSQYCKPPRPVPFAQFYPTKSEYEPYEGGMSISGWDRESVWEIEQRWIERNGCKKKPSSTRRHEDGSRCFHFDCETPFMSCHVEGGHGWPGTPPRSRIYAKLGGDGPEPDPNFPMAKLMWEFFAELEPLDADR